MCNLAFEAQSDRYDTQVQNKRDVIPGLKKIVPDCTHRFCQQIFVNIFL